MRATIQNLFFSLLLIAFLGSCENSDENAPLPTNDDAFTEGVLTTAVTMPDNPFAALLAKIDPAKGDIEQQLADEISKLPLEEQIALNESMEESGLFMIVALITPFHGQLHVRPNEILAKSTGLSYYLENYQSTVQDEGLIYMSSHSTNEDMVGTYKPSKPESDWKSATITHEDYDIERLAEEEIIAGYTCKKAIYTLKNSADIESSGNPLRLEVYTSASMPKELNFQHPFYIPEENGILKIDVTYDDAQKNKMVYEIVKVEPKQMEDKDFEIQSSPNIYDLDAEDPSAGAAMMAIMFGFE